MSTDLSKQVSIDGNQVTLADLAGFDLTGVEELRVERLPIGNYRWKAIENALDVAEAKGVKVPVVRFKLECLECFGAIDDEGKPIENTDGLVGKNFTHTIFIKEAKDIGRVKAFLKDAGFKGEGVLQDLLRDFTDHQFVCPITLYKDKNDTDKVYSNLNTLKMKPVPNGAN